MAGASSKKTSATASAQSPFLLALSQQQSHFELIEVEAGDVTKAVHRINAVELRAMIHRAGHFLIVAGISAHHR
jgi:hypothetical protein